MSAPKDVVGIGNGRRQGRSERTRRKIKAATIALLNSQNYFDMTITDICRGAGVATGGFYFHYDKKADLIEEVVREHNASFWAALMTALDYRDLYSAIFAASTALVRAYYDSPGLVRCFNQLAMIDRVYVKLWDDAATVWAARLDDMAAAGAATGRPEGASAYGLLSFADLFLFELFIEKEPGLVASAGGTDEVTENLAVLWYRALTGRSPVPARLALPNRNVGV
ncbi:MAG: TetR/AcrR family transcriptional regulator, partial [Rhizomicrobium sp.]